MKPRITDHLVAVYMTPDRILEAIAALKTVGFETTAFSLVGQNFQLENRPVGFLNQFYRENIWGNLGSAWNSVWDALPNSETFFVPKIGDVIFTGKLATCFQSETIPDDQSALECALISIGGTSFCITEYEWYLKSRRFLFIVHGSTSEVRKAKGMLNHTPAARIDLYKTSGENWDSNQ